jgi:hypothetical protein
MEWFYYYTTFAVSGAMVTWWAIFRPSIQLLAYETKGDHPMLRNQILSGLVWVSLATIAIPTLILPILNDKVRLNFIVSLTQGFLHSNSKN